MKFILNRDETIGSTTGHAIAFARGVPTHVPPEMHALVMGKGASPEQELEAPAARASAEPTDPGVRKEVILGGFRTLIRENRRESFMGTGVPHVNALAKTIGFTIDKRECETLWISFRQDEAVKSPVDAPVAATVPAEPVVATAPAEPIVATEPAEAAAPTKPRRGQNTSTKPATGKRSK